MKEFGSYIVEKLKINNSTKINTPSEEEFIDAFKRFTDKLDRSRLNNLNLKKIWPDVFDKERPRVKGVGTIDRMWYDDGDLKYTTGSGGRYLHYDKDLTDKQKIIIFDYINDRLKEEGPITEKLKINKDIKVTPSFEEFWKLLKEYGELNMEDIYSDKDYYPENELGEKIFYMSAWELHLSSGKKNTIDYKFYTKRFSQRGWAENNDLNYDKLDNKYKIELYNYMTNHLNDKS